jgi:hypothetical protein
VDLDVVVTRLSLMGASVIVWDIETVPDLKGYVLVRRSVTAPALTARRQSTILTVTPQSNRSHPPG